MVGIKQWYHLGGGEDNKLNNKSVLFLKMRHFYQFYWRLILLGLAKIIVISTKNFPNMGFVQKNFTCMQIYKCSLGIGRIQILGYVRIANVFYDCFDTIKRLRKPLFSVSLLIGKMPVRENLRINYVRLINSKNTLIFSYLLNVIERSSFSPQSYDCCFFIEINGNLL